MTTAAGASTGRASLAAARHTRLKRPRRRRRMFSLDTTKTNLGAGASCWYDRECLPGLECAGGCYGCGLTGSCSVPARLAATTAQPPPTSPPALVVKAPTRAPTEAAPPPPASGPPLEVKFRVVAVGGAAVPGAGGSACFRAARDALERAMTAEAAASGGGAIAAKAAAAAAAAAAAGGGASPLAAMRVDGDRYAAGDPLLLARAGVVVYRLDTARQDDSAEHDFRLNAVQVHTAMARILILAQCSAVS